MRKVPKTDYQQKLINGLKTNDSVILKEFYISNYRKIEILVLKNNGTIEHAKDIYQEAFISVWNNIKDNKFEPTSETALNGYLYTIAKNKWMDYLRSNDYKKMSNISKMGYFESSDDLNEKINDDILKSNRLIITMNAFKDLGDSCKSLLSKFYFDKRSIKDIAIELELDAASTRNKKYRCMQKLRELALKYDK